MMNNLGDVNNKWMILNKLLLLYVINCYLKSSNS